MNVLRNLSAHRGLDGEIHIHGKYLNHAEHSVAVLSRPRARELLMQLQALLADPRTGNNEKGEAQ